MTPLSRREFLRRSAILAAAAGGAPAVLAACGGSGPPPSATSRANKVTGKAQILVGFGTGNDPSQLPAQMKLAEAFAKANPGASVDFLRVPDSDSAKTKLTVQLASGHPPNAVLPIGIFGISTFLDQNVWLDLAPLLASSGVSLEDFQKPTSRAARAVTYYGEQTKRVVGLPSGMFTHGVGYNKDLFAKAGIPEPPHGWNTSGWTYDRLIEVATALTLDGHGRTPDKAGFDPTDIKQFGMGHWDTGIMVLGYGARMYDPKTRKLRLDTPEQIKGNQVGIDLSKRYHVLATDELAAGVAAGASDAQQGAWQAGKVAMVDLCTCDLPSYGKGNSFRWDVAAWPRGPARTVATLNLDVGAIPASSADHDLSWEVLREFLTVPANERVLATSGYGAIPPLKSQSAAFLDAIRQDYPGIDLKVFIDAIPYCTPETEEWFPAFNEVNNLAGNVLAPFYSGEANAASIFPMYQQQAQTLVDRWFATHSAPAAA